MLFLLIVVAVVVLLVAVSVLTYAVDYVQNIWLLSVLGLAFHCSVIGVSTTIPVDGNGVVIVVVAVVVLLLFNL